MTAKELKKLLAEKRWTQADLARKLAADPVTVNRWVCGRGGISARMQAEIRRVMEEVPQVEPELVRLLRDKIAIQEKYIAALERELAREG